jgi:hypothetical protein
VKVVLAVAALVLAVVLVLVIVLDRGTGSRPDGTSCRDLAVRIGLAHDDLVALGRDLDSVGEEYAARVVEDAASVLGVEVCGVE